MGLRVVSESKTFARHALAVAVALCLALQTCFPAFAAEPSSASDADTASYSFEQSSTQQDGGIDVAAGWQRGEAVIDAGGEYVLDANVLATCPLVVSVPEGQTATIDFRGHTAEVIGCSAGIDVSGSQGTVVLTDSTAEEDRVFGEGALLSVQAAANDADGDACIAGIVMDLPEGGQAQLRVENVDVKVAARPAIDGDHTCDVYGILLRGSLPDGDNSVQMPLATVLSCCVETSNETTGIACGLSVDQVRLVLGGRFASEASSIGLACDISCSSAGLMHLESDFDAKGSVCVNAVGACEGYVVATCAMNSERAGSLDLSLAGDLADRYLCCYDVSQGFFLQPTAVDGTLSNEAQVSSVDNVKADADESIDDQELFADDGEAAPAHEELTTSATPMAASIPEGAVDLNAAWAAQEGGTAVAFAISEGGTYCLTADLDVSSSLTVDAPDADVVIDLGSHVLTSTASSSLPVIDANAAASVTVQGIWHSLGKAQIVQSGSVLTHAVESASDTLVVRDVGMYLASEARLAQLDASGVYATQGSVTVEGCSIVIDHSNQTKSNDSNSGLKGCPRGIFFGSRVQDALVRDTDIVVSGSPVAEERPDEKTSLTSCANAYALYSLSTTQVTIEGGSFAASSARGSATGLYAAKARLQAGSNGSEVSIQVNAGRVAAGVRASNQQGITLDCSLDVTYTGPSTPRYKTALLGAVDNAFVFGERFSGNDLGVIIGTPGEGENADFTRIAVFENGMNMEARTRVCSMLVNALGDGATTTVAVDILGLYFSFDADKAPVEVEDVDGKIVRYATTADAVAQAKSGSTVRILADDLSVSFSKECDASNNFTLDVNGHVLASLNVSTDAHVLVMSSADKRACIRDSSSTRTAAVEHAGSGGLTIEGVDVLKASNASETNALVVSGAGSLVLRDVDIVSVGGGTAVRGVYQSSTDAQGVFAYGGSLSVSTSRAGVPACGMVLSSPAASVVEGCPISVRSTTGNVGGIDVSGPLELKGDSSGSPAVDVLATGAAACVWGVRALAQDVSVRCDSAWIKVNAGSSANTSTSACWCLMAGSPVPSVSAQWILDGACLFESGNGTHIGVAEEPIRLGSSYTSDKVATVYSVSLDNDVCFVAHDNTTYIGQCAALFEAATGSPYDGWSLTSSDETHLAWNHDDTAINRATGMGYARFSDAVAEAGEGDPIILLADCTEVNPLVIEKRLSIDVNGHVLSVDVDAESASAQNAAIWYTGTGDLRITDSAKSGQKGSVDVAIQGDSVYRSDAVLYEGFGVASGGALVVDGCTLNVRYNCDAAATDDAALAGIFSEGKGISLVGGAQLCVEVSGNSPVDAQGIFVSADLPGDSAEASTVSIDGASAIVVDNTASRMQCGTVYTDASGVAPRRRTLMQIVPDQNSDLYRQIQQKFLAEALLDSVLDTDGSVYGTNVYYAAPLTLDDGTYVWAFSSPLSEGDLGVQERIEADIFFTQSYYDEVGMATGVVVPEGASASVTLEGSVEAKSATGDATALLLEDGTVSTGDIARLVATAGDDAYRSMEGSLDLAPFLGLEKGDQTVFYPSNDSAQLVAWKNPSAQALVCAEGVSSAVSEQTSIVESDSGRYEGVPSQPEGPLPSTVHVTFSNMMDADGMPVDDIERDQAAGLPLSSGGVVPQPQDYLLADGTSYRFIGWTVDMLNLGSRVWDPRDAADSLVLDELCKASSGAIILSACYVPVLEGQYLITFKVDNYIEAVAVDSGTIASYKDARTGAVFSSPSKLTQQDGWAYGFSGWASRDGTVTYTGSLPLATCDALYTATFTQIRSQALLTFYLWKLQGGSLRYTTTTANVDYGTSASTAASTCARQGDVLVEDGVVYGFVGWSPRRTDKEALYVDVLPDVSGSETYYALYTTHEQRVDVTFYVAGQSYASAHNIAATSTVNGAFLASDNAIAPTDKSASEPFRGWATSPTAETPLMGAVKTIAELVEVEEPLSLYAVFGSSSDTDNNDGDNAGDGSDKDNGSGVDDPAAQPDSGQNDDDADGGDTDQTTVLRGGSLSVGTYGGTLVAAGASDEDIAAVVAAAAGATKDGALAEEGDEAWDDSARARAANEDEASGQGDAQSQGWSESEGNAIGFFAIVAGLLALALFVIWRLVRNRRLDAREDDEDYLEVGVGAGDAGEKVVF